MTSSDTSREGVQSQRNESRIEIKRMNNALAAKKSRKRKLELQARAVKDAYAKGLAEGYILGQKENEVPTEINSLCRVLFEMISSGEDATLKLLGRDLYCKVEAKAVTPVKDDIEHGADTSTIDNLLQTAEAVDDIVHGADTSSIDDLNSFKKTNDVAFVTKREATLTDRTSIGDECLPYAIDCLDGFFAKVSSPAYRYNNAESVCDTSGEEEERNMVTQPSCNFSVPLCSEQGLQTGPSSDTVGTYTAIDLVPFPELYMDVPTSVWPAVELPSNFSLERMQSCEYDAMGRVSGLCGDTMMCLSDLQNVKYAD
jgi:hypothetical protein